MDWCNVLQELTDFRNIESPSKLTLDTLHGSMWGLNHRYKTLTQAMNDDGQRILDYSIQRVRELTEEADFTFIERRPSRCHIGFGTYGWRYQQDVITLAQKHGCLIDTAEGYGYGKVEECLGRMLTEQAEVATKVRRDHMSPEALQNSVKRSREKLGVIPHIQLHFPHDQYPLAILNLAMLRSRGYVKSIGLGNCSVDMIEWSQRLLSDWTGDSIRSVQVRYNLMDRRIEDVLLPYCQERGILVLAYSPLGQDFRTLTRPALESIAEKHGSSLTAVALAWILSHPGVMPIPRTNSPSHLLENLQAETLELDEDDLTQLDRVYPPSPI